MEALFDLEKYLRDLEEIVNIDSGSDDLEGCSRMVHRFADWYGQAGFDVVISGGPGHTSHHGSKTPCQEGPRY